MEPYAELRDPIHGYIYASEIERDIIDTPVFQRLRRIRQLSSAHLTYPGAQHTRFEHSIGSMYLAGLAGLSLAPKADIGEEDVRLLRLAALLHDVGHGPFSHLFEEVLSSKTGVTHEDMTKRIVSGTEIASILRRAGLDPELVSQLAVGDLKATANFFNSVISGGLSVDTMDYLLRDSYFTGVEYGRVDVHRIINSLDVVEDQLSLDRAALYAFEALLIARYEMFKAVYFHRTVRAAEIMVLRAMTLSDDEFHFTNTEDLALYTSLGDEEVLSKLMDLNPSGRSHLKMAKRYAESYRSRRLMKCVFEKFAQRRDRFVQRILSHKSVRQQIAAETAGKAGIDVEDVYVDVPTAPSVPLTPSREALSSLLLTWKSPDGKKSRSIRLEELPLAGNIAGFMDMVRIYTWPEHREAVQSALAAQGFIE